MHPCFQLEISKYIPRSQDILSLKESWVTEIANLFQVVIWLFVLLHRYMELLDINYKINIIGYYLYEENW